MGDAAYINLEIEALHRRAGEMPDQTARHGSPADELVCQKRMDVEDTINLSRGHIGPAEAERRHALLLHHPEYEAPMTTRGASGVMLQTHWQMMGALEAADGMLLFGISTAFIFTVMQFYYQHLVLLERPDGSVKVR